jgi:BMFP domain-containing protein YqiC
VNFATLTGITYIRRITMLNAKVFEDISAKISEAANSGPAKDIEKNVRALLAQGFAKLDLVTREEFDVQAQVLARTREKLAALEARVAELEAQRNKTPLYA